MEKCPIPNCKFTAKKPWGIKVHMGRMHPTAEQVKVRNSARMSKVRAGRTQKAIANKVVAQPVNVHFCPNCGFDVQSIVLVHGGANGKD